MKCLTEFQLFRKKKASVVGTAAATKQHELLPNTEIAIAD